MAVKASNFKNWCTENISPQSWTRISLKCLTEVRENGLTLKEMEDAEPDFDIPESLVASLHKALQTLYDMEVEDSLLIRY
ncbi:MAG: hypothetical protein ACJA0X_000368 [Cyclobacteriaceae bacterium]|jgi:hypothetical protein